MCAQGQDSATRENIIGLNWSKVTRIDLMIDRLLKLTYSEEAPTIQMLLSQ